MVVREVIANWPNAEDVVKAICRGVEVNGAPVSKVGRETPPGEKFVPPVIRIERIGGEIDRNGLSDWPLVEVACFGDGYAQAQAMSTSVTRLMLASVGRLYENACIDVARMENGPIRPAWSSDARRDLTQWRLSWRPTYSD